MGQCCKCGRETEHAYEYYTGDKHAEEAIVSYGIITHESMEKCSDFICNRCVMMFSLIQHFISFAMCLGLAIWFRGLWSGLSWIVFGVEAAIFLGLGLYRWIYLLRDKRPTRKSDMEMATRYIIEIKYKQNPDNAYYTSLEYEKRTGGIVL
jgi:hypothetical protein